jgi:hypothetical protein
MNEQGVMVVLDATRSRMQIKMWILFVKNMFAGSALAERFCCRTTNAFAFQSSLCSTSLYFRPPLAMIYVLDLVWRFSQKTWSTGISAGKHETLLISHGCEWNVEESIKLVGWHWNLNWRLQLNCKWIIAELQKRNFILTLFFECEISSTRCSQDIQDDIVITSELWHSIKVCLLMSYCSFFQSWTAF